MTKRLLLAGGFACLFLGLCSCSLSRDLTRERALNLIRSSQAAKAALSIRVSTGKYILGDKYILGFPSADYTVYRALQSLGLLEIKENPPVANPLNMTQMVPSKKGVYLTARGQSRASKNTGLIGTFSQWQGDQVWSFVTAERRNVVAVTGIRTEGKGQAMADFSWKWKLNNIGEALGKAGCLPNGGKCGLTRGTNPVQSGSAEFALYDDGWRLQGIQW